MDTTRRREVRTGRATIVETPWSPPLLGGQMTEPELDMLVFLSTNGVRTVRSLATHLKLERSSIERARLSLVARGLVITVPAAPDHHERVVTLSTAGRRIVGDLIDRRARELARTPETQEER